MRKSFMFLLTIVAMGIGVFIAEAQQPKKVPQIGVITGATSSFAPPYIEAARRGFFKLGYSEGQMAVEYRFGEGKYRRLPELAAELVRLKVDVIVAVGDPAIYAAREATKTIPIVMMFAGNPVAGGLVASLARPGGNLTGTTFLTSELAGKRLELLKEVTPKASRTFVLWNPQNPGGSLDFRETEVGARQLGMTMESLEVRDSNEIDRAFAKIIGDLTHSLIVLTDPVTIRNRKQIANLAIKNRLPSMYELRELVDDGGLMSYGPSLLSIIERTAFYVDKILKGAKAAELPVEQPTTFELYINLKTAKQIGITIPQSVLFRADKIIQ